MNHRLLSPWRAFLLSYGNIGAACARLAKAYGMRVLALRRNPELSRSDSNVDEVRAACEASKLSTQSTQQPSNLEL